MNYSFISADFFNQLTNAQARIWIKTVEGKNFKPNSYGIIHYKNERFVVIYQTNSNSDIVASTAMTLSDAGRMAREQLLKRAGAEKSVKN